MDSKPDRSLREIFLEAAEMEDPQARAAYLDQACKGHWQLRRRVEELLVAESQAGGPPPSAQPSNDPALGSQVGHYKLLQQIGEGGCGVVFMAEQEQPVRRKVALKVIKLGMDTKQVVARFEAERQALAMMDHPNIAQVFDAGATGSGRPYFVMELVRGIKITDYCDQHQHSTRQRLDLFIQVCQAVQHAHQKGIIHRDLKPSNILVTELDGVPLPKIIDFGIAKAVEGRLTDQTLFTAFEQFIGTPAYMSPEQAALNASDVDTRSDVYSLGVLLYELLTGETPFDTKRLLAAGLDEMRRTIREVDPVRPSTRLRKTSTTSRLASSPVTRHLSLATDLDWIVMKCLEKDRGRRYETANDLARDVQRHLKDEPIVARPPSRIYEFQKSVRRHKIGFAATATVILALVAGFVVSSLQAARARQAEAVARHQAYVSDMKVAQQYLNGGHLGRARELLRRYVPNRTEKTDLRNWEWRYLAQQCQGDEHASLPGHKGRVSNVRFLDPQTLVTTGMSDYRTRLWNWPERRLLNVFTNGGSSGGVGVGNLAFWPSHRGMIWNCGWRGNPTEFRQLDFQTGDDKRFHPLGTNRPQGTIALSPDGHFLAFSPGDRAMVFDLSNRAVVAEFPLGQTGWAVIRFSPDGKLLATADAVGRVHLWDFPNRLPIPWSNAPPPSTTLDVLEFSPDSQWLVTCRAEQTLEVWNLRTRARVAELPEPGRHGVVAFSPDGRRLATGGYDSTLRVWNTATWTVERTLRGHLDWITCVSFSPDGQWLVSGSRNGEVLVWPLKDSMTGKEQVVFDQTAQDTFVAPDGSGFVRLTAGDKPTDEVWSSPPLERLQQQPVPTNVVQFLLLPGARRGVFAFRDGRIQVRNLLDSRDAVVSQSTPDYVWRWAVSSDGFTLVSENSDGEAWTICLWRLPALEPVARKAIPREFTDLAVSPDGRFLALFTGRGFFETWQLPSLAPLGKIDAYQPVTTLEGCFSPHARRLAVACSDGTGHIWDPVSQMLVAPLPGDLSNLAFSPDSTRLAGSTLDEVKLLDAETAEEVASWKSPGGERTQLMFTRDGQDLIAVGPNAAQVWHAPPLDQIRFDWLKPTPPVGPTPQH